MKPIDVRQQRKFDKKQEEKSLIRLWRRKDALWQARRKLDLVKLPKPIRAGYKRYFVLRDDIAKSREANFYNGMLKLVQNVVVSSNKNFVHKDWKSKKVVPIIQEISDIDHSKWNKLKLTPKQQACFERFWVLDMTWRNGKIVPVGNGKGRWMYRYTKPWMFVHKREPFYITHKVLIKPELVSEMKEIDNRIRTHDLMPKIFKILGYSYNEHGDASSWEKRRDKLIVQSIMEAESINAYDEWESELFDGAPDGLSKILNKLKN